MSTIAKVAERAGVSRTTVSHVVNHASRVSKPLRERVQAAIDELGYVPNRQAQSLRTGRTNVVALLTADIHNPFYTEMVRTVQAELVQLRAHVVEGIDVGEVGQRDRPQRGPAGDLERGVVEALRRH